MVNNTETVRLETTESFDLTVQQTCVQEPKRHWVLWLEGTLVPGGTGWLLGHWATSQSCGREDTNSLSFIHAAINNTENTVTTSVRPDTKYREYQT